MTNAEKVIVIDSEKRCMESCSNVKRVLERRPWVTGEIIETERFGADDAMGIDLFVPVEEGLLDFLCMEHNAGYLKFQVKSSDDHERKFKHKHRSMMWNLGGGETIFVLNGQDRQEVMLASLVGQMVLMAGQSGYVNEEYFLAFLAENMDDSEAVAEYCWHKDKVIKRKKWFEKEYRTIKNRM